MFKCMQYTLYLVMQAITLIFSMCWDIITCKKKNIMYFLINQFCQTKQDWFKSWFFFSNKKYIKNKVSYKEILILFPKGCLSSDFFLVYKLILWDRSGVWHIAIWIWGDICYYSPSEVGFPGHICPRDTATERATVSMPTLSPI